MEETPTMTTYSEYKQKVLDLFALGHSHAEALKHPSIVQRLDEARDRLVTGRLLVVICGEFKRGKSNLINALLGVPDLCPVDIDITTSLVTTIAWAEEEQITVVLGEPGNEKSTSITRAEIADYVTEQRNPHNRRQAQRLLILGPFAPLKDGLVLVDTPGIGGLNTEHAAVTYAILPEADAAVFVTDAIDPLTKPELDFVRDWVARYCQHIITAVTKIDASPDYQTAVADARQKLATTLACPAESLTVVPVSSRLKLQCQASGDASALTESNFAALEEALWQGVGAQADTILLTGALADLAQVIVDLREVLDAEMEVHQPSQANAARQLAAKVTEARERLQSLQAQNAQWVRHLNEGLSDIERSLRRRAEDTFSALTVQMTDALFDPDLVKRPEKIVDKLTPQIVRLGLDLRNVGKTQATALQDRLKETTGLTLTAADNLQPKAAPKPVVKLPRPGHGPRSFFRKAWDILLAGWDVVVSLVFVWNLPRALTRLADTVKATFTGETLSPGQLQTKLQQFLTASQTTIRRDVEDLATELRRSMSRELDELIRQDIDRCNEILKSMSAAKQVPPKQVGQRLAQIDQELAQLKDLQEQSAVLATAVGAGTLPPPRSEKDWGDFAS
jgi:GTPase Era involved in 16S rRNA processing